ncbi:hypothetical protein FRB96_001698 [Tulasnella sp. 330]|nr:hypothetical protein FRB96_001698 [Tulasnella sp. 330]
MVSLLRTLRSVQRVGIREWWRQLQSIGDAKSGRFVGMDQFGNRYYENLNAVEEIPGRHRWVDFAQQNTYDASQVPPGWHAWINHIKKEPPVEDKIYQGSKPSWQTYRESTPIGHLSILTSDLLPIGFGRSNSSLETRADEARKRKLAAVRQSSPTPSRPETNRLDDAFCLSSTIRNATSHPIDSRAKKRACLSD